MMHSLYMARGRIASYPKIYLAGSGRLRQATNGKFNYISCYQHQWQSTAPDSGIYRQYARAEKGKSNENTPNPRNKKNLQKAFRAGNRFQGRASSTSSWDNIHHDVSPYIRRCDSNPGGDPIYSRALQDSGFHIQFLGTGSGISDRMSSCTLVRLGEEGFLFDVGEGAQRHVKQSTAKVKKISRIFITHMHGDHVLGLPGLLLSSNLSNLFSEDSVLHVYGPPGIYNFIVTTLGLTHSKLRMKIEVHELVGGKVRSHKNVRGLFGNLPQFQNNDIVQNIIPCGEDGTWMIKDFDEISRDSKTRNRSNIRISAAELNHVPFVPTFGYVVEDHKPPLKIDPDLAEELGMKPSRKFDALKNGFAVMNDDGTREVQPEEVLFDHGFKARKAVILGDLCAVPPPMLRLCRDADVVVHEATLSETDDWKSARRGHASASMAGQLADAANVHLLVLNHHSATVDGNDSQLPARKAERVIQNRDTRVLSACDFMEVSIPREGFHFAAKAKDIAPDTMETKANKNVRESEQEMLAMEDELIDSQASLLPKEEELKAASK